MVSECTGRSIALWFDTTTRFKILLKEYTKYSKYNVIIQYIQRLPA